MLGRDIIHVTAMRKAYVGTLVQADSSTLRHAFTRNMVSLIQLLMEQLVPTNIFC